MMNGMIGIYRVSRDESGRAARGRSRSRAHRCTPGRALRRRPRGDDARKAYDPSQLDVLVGTTVTWRNDDSMNHTVTADERRVRLRLHAAGRLVLVHVHEAGPLRIPLRDPQVHAGRGRRLRAGPLRARGSGVAGGRVVFAGLAPAGTASVALRGPRGRSHRQAPSGRELRGAHGDRRARELPGGRGRARQPGSPDPRDAHRSRRCIGRTAPCDGHAGTTRWTAVLQAYDREHFAWKVVARGALDRASRVELRVPGGVGRARVSSSAPVGGPTASRSRSCCAAAARSGSGRAEGSPGRGVTILARR